MTDTRETFPRLDGVVLDAEAAYKVLEVAYEHVENGGKDQALLIAVAERALESALGGLRAWRAAAAGRA